MKIFDFYWRRIFFNCKYILVVFGIKLMVFYWVNFYGLNVVELILGGDDFVKYLWFFIYLVRKDCLIRFI